MRLQHSRRTTDAKPLHLRLPAFLDRIARAWDPVVGGQLMLLATGLVIVLTLPLLDQRHWRSIGAVVVLATVAAWSVSLPVPWRRISRKWTLAFPLAVWTALAILGSVTHGLAASYAGLLVLWFAYIGLTHKRGTSVVLLPAAVVSYVIMWGGWSTPLLARLLIAVAIWLLLAELLATLMAQQRHLAEELRQLAHVDTLTNLANRRDLDLRVAEARPGDCVVVCDLDHFKQLNDTLGHAAGDRVLAEFGLVIRATLRQHDYAARYGGEEFALLLPATSHTQARATLARLHERWAILHPGVTFSSGIAIVNAERDISETIKEADDALYAAKAAGRDRDHSIAGPLYPMPVASVG